MTNGTNGRVLLELVTRAAAATRRQPDAMSVSASWTDSRDWEAGVSADGDCITVYYGPASRTVETAEEAADLLKAIFADEVVCVTALHQETPIHSGLAPHDDITASFNFHAPKGMPVIDHVLVRSWTGKYDRE